MMLKTVLLRNQSVTHFRYCHGHRTFRSFLSTATSAQPLKGQIPLIINGKDVVTKASFPLVGPLTNEEVWTASSASVQDAADAANAAQSAFSSWSRTKPSYRRDIFLRAADVMAKRKDELGEYMRQEIGADEGYQQFILDLAIEGLKDTAGRIAGACAGSLPDSIHDGMRAMVQKRPYGVVLGIAPW
jgi:acyl-CoA reductase-like NAD-dependent aldehyde dehydrogenase